MNRGRRNLLWLSLSCVIVCAVPGGPATAEEETIACVEVFGTLQRPPVPFDHDSHLDALDSDCDACHHVYDKSKGGLVSAGGEEQRCAECHGAEKEGEAPALREAFHGQCVSCHRKKNRQEDRPWLPVTCGRCHPRK